MFFIISYSPCDNDRLHDIIRESLSACDLPDPELFVAFGRCHWAEEGFLNSWVSWAEPWMMGDSVDWSNTPGLLGITQSGTSLHAWRLMQKGPSDGLHHHHHHHHLDASFLSLQGALIAVHMLCEDHGAFGPMWPKASACFISHTHAFSANLW